jgi:hypothetical protein
VALLGLDERPVLAEIAGEDVERAVYRYAACDRARTWRDLTPTGQVWDRFTRQAEELAPDELREFADLSLVNELDVAEHAPGFLDEHGPFFRRLTDRWTPVLSPAVAAEARWVLG